MLEADEEGVSLLDVKSRSFTESLIDDGKMILVDLKNSCILSKSLKP